MSTYSLEGLAAPQLAQLIVEARVLNRHEQGECHHGGHGSEKEEEGPQLVARPHLVAPLLVVCVEYAVQLLAVEQVEETLLLTVVQAHSAALVHLDANAAVGRGGVGGVGGIA